MASAAPETLLDRDISRQLTETLSTNKPTYLGNAGRPWCMMLMAAHPDPCCHGWLHKVLVLLLNSKCQVKTAALARGLFPSLFYSPHVKTTASLLSSRCFSLGGNIARTKFHKFLCMNKTEALEDRAEGEGKIAEILGIQSGANPQQRKIPLPHRPQRTVLATVETYSWALLSRELSLWTFSCIYRGAGYFI